MDINFFEEYSAKKINGSNLFIILLILFLILSLVLITIYNQFRITNLNNGIRKKIAIIENPKSQEKLLEIEELNIELIDSKVKAESLSTLDMDVNNKNKLTEELLSDIELCIPEGIILLSMNFNYNTFELTGVAPSPTIIATYSKSIQTTDNILEVYISNISLNKDYYNFLINLKLKGDTIEEFD